MPHSLTFRELNVSPRTPRNTCVYTCHPAQCHATCGVLTRLPAKLAKKRNADPWLKNKLRVYTASDANWLRQSDFSIRDHVRVFNDL